MCKVHARWFAEYGVELPTLPVSTEDRAVTRISEQMLDYLRRSKEQRTREEIEAHTKGKTVHKRSALKRLLATGRVVERGAGTKGNPLRYGTRIANTRMNTDGILVPEKLKAFRVLTK